MANIQRSTDSCGNEIKPNDIYLKRFKVVKVLSNKDSVVIFLAEDIEKNNEFLIIKQIDTDKKSEALYPMADARRALCIQSKVNHPHVMRQTYFNEDMHFIVLTMPYANRNNLGEMLTIEEHLTDEGKIKIIRSLLSAIYFCHTNGFAHNNITVENVLVDEVYNAYLTGFQHHKSLKNKYRSYEFELSELYKAPEIYREKFYSAAKADMWAAGVVLYKLIVGDFPYRGSTFFRKIFSDNPEGAYKLIASLLRTDPKRRYNISQACEDPWLNENEKENCLAYAQRLVEEDHKFKSTKGQLQFNDISIASVQNPARVHLKRSYSADAILLHKEFKKAEKLSLTEKFKELEEYCKGNNVQMKIFDMVSRVIQMSLDEEQQESGRTDT